MAVALARNKNIQWMSSFPAMDEHHHQHHHQHHHHDQHDHHDEHDQQDQHDHQNIVFTFVRLVEAQVVLFADVGRIIGPYLAIRHRCSQYEHDEYDQQEHRKMNMVNMIRRRKKHKQSECEEKLQRKCEYDDEYEE